jgi:hypothetical protein
MISKSRSRLRAAFFLLDRSFLWIENEKLCLSFRRIIFGHSKYPRYLKLSSIRTIARTALLLELCRACEESDRSLI